MYVGPCRSLCRYFVMRFVRSLFIDACLSLCMCIGSAVGMSLFM